jgi:GNAT superfamily N-acetyltransferase
MATSDRSDILIKPITKARFADFEALMRTNSITAGCWDIFYRRTNEEGRARHAFWKARGVDQGEGNRREMRTLTASGKSIGLLAYDGKDPVGFASVGPRSKFPRTDQSKATPAFDDLPVWVVPCFYVRRSHRGRGVTVALLREAVGYAAKRGAPAVEGYPRAAGARRLDDMSAFYGSEAQFQRAGYRRVRGVRTDLPRGWAPRVTMRATCAPVRRKRTSSTSRTRSRAAS